MNDKEMYILLDLERTIKTGISTYWKPHNHGYTRILEEAGLYTEYDAKSKEANDLDKRTIAISGATIRGLL